VLVDSDVVIWNCRGNTGAARFLASVVPFHVSAVTYMELLQGVRNRRELKQIKDDLTLWGATILAVTETISARAVELVERHCLRDHLQMADALIAATALDHKLVLATGNIRHFKGVKGLPLHPFRPDQV
jgi:predicted nucleic acid-binding protein